MDLEDLDFTCVVAECNSIQKSMSNGSVKAYCQTHNYMDDTYGTPTPEIACADCKSHFIFGEPGSKFNKKGQAHHLCPKCAAILNKYSHLLPKSVNHIVSAYKITPVKYLNMVIEQNFSCKLCLEPTNKFVIDHDHKCCSGNSNTCGKCVRGLLCYTCNIITGYVEVHQDIVARIPDYLSNYKGRKL